MKKKSLIVLLLLSGVGQVSAQSTFSISGTIPSMKEGSEVSLISQEGQESKTISSSKIVGGKFLLTGKFKHTELCTLSFFVPSGKKDPYRVADIRMMLDCTPMTFVSDTATILADYSSLKKEGAVSISGSKIENEYRDFLNFTRPAEYTADSASYAEADAWFRHQGDELAIADYKQRCEMAKSAYESIVDQYVASHPNHYPTAALLSKRLYRDFTYTASQLDGFLNLLKNNPDTAHVKFIKKNIDIAKKYALNSPYTDFTGMNSKKEKVRFSSLMKPGKYTLVDFWASWCGPCRSAIPKVKTIAKKYSDKLQVISASLDAKEQEWRKAEKQEAMTWPQLLISQDELQKVVAPGYMISAIPRLVLISPDGHVLIATHDPQFINEKLAEQK